MHHVTLKPVIFFALILLVLGGAFACWMALGPSLAIGAGGAAQGERRPEVHRIIREIENQ